MFFSLVFLAFSGAIWYHYSMLKRIEIALEIVVKNSAFDRLNSARKSLPPAPFAQAFSPVVRHLVRVCEQAAQAPKELSSGFGAALQRTVCAALLRQPGTHPRRLRSAAF